MCMYSPLPSAVLSTSTFTFLFVNKLRVLGCRVNVARVLSNIKRRKSTATMDLFKQAQQIGSEKHPKIQEQFIPYGTAGFRAKATTLDHVMFRMGLLAALRSRSKSAAIGVMVTASHNPVDDNGVKLVDPLGEMLEPQWEKLAMELANAPDVELASSLTHIVNLESIDMSKDAEVFVGEDTRPSSSKFSTAVQEGAKVLNAKVTAYGVITTPMLHYFVASYNSDGAYGEPTENGYFDKLTEAFKIFHHEVCSEDKPTQEYDYNVICDAANGVGALKMVPLQQRLSGLLNFEVVNSGEGELNKECGADYVKTRQQKPKNVKNRPKNRCVSFDGDADRIVYFYEDATPTFHLLDGDRIATLVAGYIKELLDKLELNLNLGLVQTAYANGASTKYIEEVLKIPVACVPTGVKHLHHKAQEFDVGVYFEANGHGTVLFKKAVKKAVKEIREEKRFSGAKRGAARKMLALIDLTNETVGDAISDLLLVESILLARGWTVEDWENTYKDFPYRQIKVTVLDRNVVETVQTGRSVVCVSPPDLQEAIDNLVKNFENGRAFVRASGTEDIVRVYAEASTQSSADKLAVLVARAVYKMAGGFGELPTHVFK